MSIILRRARFWDLAATKDAGDWTVGCRGCRDSDGQVYIEDMRRGQWSPAEVEREMKDCAREDTAAVPIGVEREGGSHTKFTEMYLTKLLSGYRVTFYPAGRKIGREGEFASQCEQGNVHLVGLARAPDGTVHPAKWHENFLKELISFPNGLHDDQVYAACGMFAMVAFGAQIEMGLIGRYTTQGEIIRDSSTGHAVDRRTLTKFAVCRFASSQYDESMFQVWMVDTQTSPPKLYLAGAWAGRTRWDETKVFVQQMMDHVSLSTVFVEKFGMFEAAEDIAAENSVSCEVVTPRGMDDLSKALISAVDRQQISLPGALPGARSPAWVEEVKAEWASWDGDNADCHAVRLAGVACQEAAHAAASWGGVPGVVPAGVIPGTGFPSVAELEALNNEAARHASVNQAGVNQAGFSQAALDSARQSSIIGHGQW